MEPPASDVQPHETDESECRLESSKPRELTCLKGPIAPTTERGHDEQEPWRTWWERSPSSKRFLLAKNLLPGAICKKCKASDEKSLSELIWSLQDGCFRTCWQCLIVLTMTETILGRPLSSNEKVGVCGAGHWNRRCCTTHSAQQLFYINAFHVVTGAGSSPHIMFNIYTCSSSEPYLLPILCCPKLQESSFDLLSSHSYKIASIWLESCLEDHPKCSGLEKTPLPRRLVFVGGGPERIHIVEDNKPVFGRYTCLSHCWGTKQPLKTTKINMESHRRNIAWESIPKTFQDAIKLTQFLGVSYLWIDSLCIIQDDSDDWAEESCKMCDIYENSYLTIAATTAFDSSQGLAIRESANIARLRGSTISNVPFDLVGYIRPESSRCNRSTSGHPHPPPLFTRAWVLQERILAPRVVHFFKEELMWECRTMTFCECRPAHSGVIYSGGTPKEVFDRGLNEGHNWRIVSSWHMVLRTYSSLNLSHEAGKLPALSGLAKHNARLRPSARYLAGLWSNSLMIDALWSSYYNYETKVDSGPKEWRAPSWSWAAHNTVLRLPMIPNFMLGIVQGLKCETTLATLDPTGKVSSGSMVLSGRLHDAQISRAFHEKRELREEVERKGILTLTITETGAQIASIFEFTKEGSFYTKGVNDTATLAMDSPFELLYSENDMTKGGNYYEGSDVKCLPWTCMGYMALREGRGTTWEEDRKDIGEGNGKEDGQNDEKTTQGKDGEGNEGSSRKKGVGNDNHDNEKGITL